MVKGLDTFREYFADYEEQYVLIGGAACDIVFESNEANFRATRDLDMDLIKAAKISTNAMAKLGKNEDVRLGVLVKICETLDYKLDDIVEII